jgi:hypothetical protein
MEVGAKAQQPTAAAVSQGRATGAQLCKGSATRRKVYTQNRLNSRGHNTCSTDLSRTKRFAELRWRLERERNTLMASFAVQYPSPRWPTFVKHSTTALGKEFAGSRLLSS